MSLDLTTLAGWLALLSPDGMPSPLVIALSLALLTLLLEDAAIAAGVALGLAGQVSWELAFLSVAGGIAVGDLLLYAAGAGLLKLPALARRVEGAPRAERARALLHRNLATAVFVARVVPGLRLAVYTAAGALAAPLGRFTLLVCVAVAAWTGGLFALGAGLGHVLSMTLGLPGWAVALALLLPLALIPTLAARLKGA